MTSVEKLAAQVIDEVLDAVEKAHPEIQVEDEPSLLYGDEYYNAESLVVGIIGDWLKEQVNALISADVDLARKEKS